MYYHTTGEVAEHHVCSDVMSDAFSQWSYYGQAMYVFMLMYVGGVYRQDTNLLQ